MTPIYVYKSHLICANITTAQFQPAIFPLSEQQYLQKERREIARHDSTIASMEGRKDAIYSLSPYREKCAVSQVLLFAIKRASDNEGNINFSVKLFLSSLAIFSLALFFWMDLRRHLWGVWKKEAKRFRLQCMTKENWSCHHHVHKPEEKKLDLSLWKPNDYIWGTWANSERSGRPLNWPKVRPGWKFHVWLSSKFHPKPKEPRSDHRDCETLSLCPRTRGHKTTTGRGRRWDIEINCLPASRCLWCSTFVSFVAAIARSTLTCCSRP